MSEFASHIPDPKANISGYPVFVICLGLVLAWAVTGPFVKFSHGWVDVLQTIVALVTFLMVALLENEGWRANKSTQRLNAIASALAEVMEHSEVSHEHVRQLNAAVGIKKKALLVELVGIRLLTIGRSAAAYPTRRRGRSTPAQRFSHRSAVEKPRGG